MKQFVFRFLFCSLLLLGSLALYNYKYDVYGLLNLTEYSALSNDHFLKVRYLLGNPLKFNAFCFGSSRVGHIDLTKIANGLQYYNMTYPDGLPKEWLDDVRIFLKHDMHIKQILVGIDDFSFRIDPSKHAARYGRIPYDDNGNIRTYLACLLRVPDMSIRKLRDKSVFSYIYGIGMNLNREAEAPVEQDIINHVHDEKFLKSKHHVLGNRIDETIQTFSELKSLCDENDIELIVFINPIHRTAYLANNLDEFNEFKRRLAEVTNYYDFSGLNKVTMNNNYYLETTHYRFIVGDMIVQRIFHPEQGVNFGVWVTKDNVEGHIRELEKQIIQEG